LVAPLPLDLVLSLAICGEGASHKCGDRLQGKEVGCPYETRVDAELWAGQSPSPIHLGGNPSFRLCVNLLMIGLEERANLPAEQDNRRIEGDQEAGDSSSNPLTGLIDDLPCEGIATTRRLKDLPDLHAIGIIPGRPSGEQLSEN
jgi:hypothetical protein